jgi:hypothetical protein
MTLVRVFSNLFAFTKELPGEILPQRHETRPRKSTESHGSLNQEDNPLMASIPILLPFNGISVRDPVRQDKAGASCWLKVPAIVIACSLCSGGPLCKGN